MSTSAEQLHQGSINMEPKKGSDVRLFIDLDVCSTGECKECEIQCSYFYHTANNGVVSIAELATYFLVCRRCEDPHCVAARVGTLAAVLGIGDRSGAHGVGGVAVAGRRRARKDEPDAHVRAERRRAVAQLAAVGAVGDSTVRPARSGGHDAAAARCAGRTAGQSARSDRRARR